MKIFVNGDAHEIAAAGTLAAAAYELGFGGSRGGDGGERPLRAGERRARRRALTDGDRIEVVAPMQGG